MIGAVETRCPSCGETLSREDLAGGDLVCGGCGARTPAAELLFPEPESPPAPEEAPRGVEVLPSVLPSRRSESYRDAFRQEGELEMRWRWFGFQYVFLLFFCLFWDGFLVVWYANAASAPGAFAIVAMCFPLLHVAVGVGLTYFTLAGLLNRTTVELAEGELSVRHGPLPWRGGGSHPARDIRSVHVRTRRGRKGRPRIEVHGEVAGADVLLVNELGSRERADYVARTLRAHLGLDR